MIGSVIAAFNFCCASDDLDVNPITGYTKPTATPRITAFLPEEEKALYETADEALGLFIKGCMLTGARPYSELAKVTADHVGETPQGMYFLLKARTADGQHGHKTAKKTGKDRRIMLCDEMETITRRLMLTAPKGSGISLFRAISACLAKFGIVGTLFREPCMASYRGRLSPDEAIQPIR